jgi:S1-C subfamily serine protease
LCRLPTCVRTRSSIEPDASRPIVVGSTGLRGLSRTPDGVALGDIVAGIGGTPVNNYDDFYNTLDEHHAGEDVDVKPLRAGHVVTVRLPLVAVQ